MLSRGKTFPCTGRAGTCAIGSTSMTIAGRSIWRGVLGEAYNIGANDERMNIEVARRIVKLVGASKDLIKFVPDRLGHDRRYAVNINKIKALGWKREIDFEDGIESTVKWYVDNRDWWTRIKERSVEFKSFYENYYKDRK
jgi:dTDP-glucose 4,6-dehydratase